MEFGHLKVQRPVWFELSNGQYIVKDIENAHYSNSHISPNVKSIES
jgi:hypothetical protein